MHKAKVSRAEADVDGREVAQTGREQGFEEEAEVHGRVDHALGADRQPPGLADHEVGPLHDDDGHEERRLRGVEEPVDDSSEESRKEEQGGEVSVPEQRETERESGGFVTRKDEKGSMRR